MTSTANNANRTVGNQKNSLSATIKFFLYSFIGIFLFFVTIPYNGAHKVPMVHCMGIIQNWLGYRVQEYIILVTCIGVLIASMVCKFGKNVPAFLKETYRRDSWFSYFTYATAAVFSVMVVFNVGPAIILDPEIGGSAVGVAADSFAAIMVAGTLVCFITDFGLLEFVGKILEPLMRRIYLLPGKSAVDALASFVIAPAAGVMITNSLYNKNVYTEKEACSIMTNFSIASLGGFAFLSAIAGIPDLFSEVVLGAFIATFVVGAIIIRIPPLSCKKNVFVDGRVQTDEERAPESYHKDTLKMALHEGVAKAGHSSPNVFLHSLKNSFMFGVKVNAFVVSLSIVCLLIANHTPLTQIIGVPMVPILTALGIPDASVIAPSTLIGIFGLAIPSVLIKGKTIAAAAAFFVVVLSTSQIIFFTESANAMLESDVPVSFWDLVVIFFIRTVILLPIVAGLTAVLL